MLQPQSQACFNSEIMLTEKRPSSADTKQGLFNGFDFNFN